MYPSRLYRDDSRYSGHRAPSRTDDLRRYAENHLRAIRYWLHTWPGDSRSQANIARCQSDLSRYLRSSSVLGQIAVVVDGITFTDYHDDRLVDLVAAKIGISVPSFRAIMGHPSARNHNIRNHRTVGW